MNPLEKENKKTLWGCMLQIQRSTPNILTTIGVVVVDCFKYKYRFWHTIAYDTKDILEEWDTISKNFEYNKYNFEYSKSKRLAYT